VGQTNLPKAASSKTTLDKYAQAEMVAEHRVQNRIVEVLRSPE